MAAVSYDELSASFNDEEIKDLMARSTELGLKDGASRSTFLRHRLTMKQQEQAEAIAALRESPSFQTRVVEQQLPEGSTVDMTGEALSPVQGFQKTASPFVGGYGGASTLEGEMADVRAMFPGKDVRAASVPTATGDRPLLFVQKDDGQYEPVNAPSVSPADFNAMIGDFFTLESVGSLLPFYGPAKRAKILARAVKSGTGAAAGAAVDTVLDEKFETDFAHVMARSASAFGLAMVGEGLADTSQRVANFAFGRGSASDAASESFRRAGRVQELGGPLFAGQISPNTWTGNMRRRWEKYDPILREQITKQNLWAGAQVQGAIDQFVKADGVDQALIVGGLDLGTLDAMEREYGQALQARAIAALDAAGTQSRSRAGRDVQTALFDITNKEKASYRMLGNARLNALEEQLLDQADEAGQFTIGLQLPIRSAKEELARFPILQRQPERVATDQASGREILGAGVKEIQAKHHEDLRFVLETLAGLPEDFVHSKATYQVRVGRAGNLEEQPLQVDGNGDLRVPYSEKGRGGLPARLGEGGPSGQQPNSPVIGTYELNGVELVRMMRSKLRDFFGNPLVPAGSYDARVAKQMYGQLGETLEQVEAPAFAAAVKRYNKSASNYLGRMDQLQTAKFAREEDAQGLVTQFTSGGMGFETLSTVKNTLRRVPDHPEAWQNFKNTSTRDFVQNPDKIKNLDIEPKSALTMYSPEELTALRTYGAEMELLQSQGFSAVARRASGVRGRGLSLFQTLPDEKTFAGFWGRLSDVDQNVVRVAVLEDLLARSSRSTGGEKLVLDPRAYTNNVNQLLQGDKGARARLVLPESTIKVLEDTQTVTAFYKEVQGTTDAGASIAASETAGAVQGNLMEGDLKGGIIAGARVQLNKMLAGSLADGVLSRVLAPRLKDPWNFAKTQMFVTMAATAVNNDQHAAATDFDKALREQGTLARRRAIIPAREK